MTAAKKLIILTDVGDTIINEETEIRKVPFGVVYQADCIPGAKETMLALYQQGYTIALVADGLAQSFRNTMEGNGLAHIFSAWVVSEKLGVEKPDPLMFETAFQKLGLTEKDKPRVIMVGNNLKRDIAGANRFGITSVHMNWSRHYPAAPSCPEEEPDHRISSPSQLLELAARLEKELEEKERHSES